jgi:succinate dehydrogenase / fumarate reductase, cytochrome b subunit
MRKRTVLAIESARKVPQRPISPHLEIYRFTWTMAMSIFHRITGMAAYGAMILLVVWLGAAASGPGAFDTVSGLFGSWIGVLVLILVSWSVIHHAIGGVRHMVWDTGRALDRTSRMFWAQATLAGSLCVTILLWLAIYLGA